MISSVLASYVVKSRYEDIPQDVRDEATRALLNFVGCALGEVLRLLLRLLLSLLARLSTALSLRQPFLLGHDRTPLVGRCLPTARHHRRRGAGDGVLRRRAQPRAGVVSVSQPRSRAAARRPPPLRRVPKVRLRPRRGTWRLRRPPIRVDRKPDRKRRSRRSTVGGPEEFLTLLEWVPTGGKMVLAYMLQRWELVPAVLRNLVRAAGDLSGLRAPRMEDAAGGRVDRRRDISR